MADDALGRKLGRAPESSDELNAVVVPVTDVLDLHSFPPCDIGELVEEYLREVKRLGITELRIIHGRGIGVQRDRVRKILARDPDVLDFGDAPGGSGGWGATVVRLRS